MSFWKKKREQSGVSTLFIAAPSLLDAFIKTSPRTPAIDGTYGRHRDVLNSRGEVVAFMWFKWALGGWNIFIKSTKEKLGPIESLEQLTAILENKCA